MSLRSPAGTEADAEIKVPERIEGQSTKEDGERKLTKELKERERAVDNGEQRRTVGLR